MRYRTSKVDNVSGFGLLLRCFLQLEFAASVAFVYLRGNFYGVWLEIFNREFRVDSSFPFFFEKSLRWLYRRWLNFCFKFERGLISFWTRQRDQTNLRETRETVSYDRHVILIILLQFTWYYTYNSRSFLERTPLNPPPKSSYSAALVLENGVGNK